MNAPAEKSYNPRLNFNSSPVSWRFLHDRAFFTGIMGPLGSGKSVTCCAKIMALASQQEPDATGYRRTRWAIIRNTYPELRSTTIKTWLEVFPEQFCGPIRYSHPITHHIKRPPVGDEPGLDCEVMFIALDRPDDVAKLKSLDLTGAWVNEAVEIPAGVIDMLTGRVGRFPGSPIDEADGEDNVLATWAGIICDTNAPDDQNWWYKYAEEGAPQMRVTLHSGEEIVIDWHFYRQPPALIEVELVGDEYFICEAGMESYEVDENQVMPAAGRFWWVNDQSENIANLRPGYYHQQVMNKTLEWINRYMQAKYILFVPGKPWMPEYSDMAMSSEFKVDPNLDLLGGLDAGGGTLNPAAVVGQRSLLGQWRTLWELSIFEIGVERFTETLKAGVAAEFSGMVPPKYWMDPAASKRDEVQMVAVEKHYRAAGLNVELAPSNDPMVRREALALPMNRNIVVHGRASPGFLVHKKCVMLRAGLSGKWFRKRVQTTTERYTERPEKNEWSHVCDAESYMLLGGGEHSILTRGAATAGRQKHEHAQATTSFNPFDT